MQLNIRKVNDPIKKWAKELNRQFSKEDIQTHEKMLSITYYQRNANQNHNEVRWFRMAAIKKYTNKKSCRGCGAKGTLLRCWWECKLVQPLWKTVWRFLKKLEIELPYDPAIPLLGIHTEETRNERHMYPNVHCSTVTITKM